MAYTGRFYFSIGNYLHYFVIGVMLSDYAVHSGFRKSSALYDLLFVFGLVIFYLAGLTQWVHLDTGSNVARNLVYIPAILLVFAGGMQGRFSSAFLSNVYVSLVGGACYSIYLVHVPAMQFVYEVAVRVGVTGNLLLSIVGTLLLLVLVSLVAGMGFYVLVERPCMNPNWPQRLVAFFRQQAARSTGRN